MTIVRDTAPETPPTTRRSFAELLIREAANHSRQADRALASLIRAGRLHGLDTEQVCDAAGMEWVDVLACLDRWAGDQS